MSAVFGPPASHFVNALAERVLVLTPSSTDASALRHVLEGGGYLVHICPNMTGIVREISRDRYTAAATVIIASDAFGTQSEQRNRVLLDVLTDQPTWSDLPVILLSGIATDEERAWTIARAIIPVGNVTILERPLRRTTLLNAVAVALRARARQYEMRATLEELAGHRERLSDLVEQRTAELAASMATLHASERLVSLGTLAAGLGHDIANLTLPIRARLDTLRTACTRDDGLADVDAINVALTHLSRLSAGMRLMGMDPEREAASAHAFELSTWSAETEPMLRASLPRAIRLVCEVPPGLGVAVARHRLAQAIFNLVQNAGEAMAGQSTGTIRVTAEPATDLAGAPMVRLRVSDDGPGMPPDVLARCFDPYFSTKGRAIATGMGLGMVKGIVEVAHGTVEVESVPGQGTTFTLMLPAAITSRHDPTVLKQNAAAAISLSNERLAGLVRMFLAQLAVNSELHREPEAPGAMLWVLDDADYAQLLAYLRHDPRCRAIVLGSPGHNGHRPVEDFPSDVLSRLTVLPPRPPAAALREALFAARAALERAEHQSVG
jgi:signal transduction histidine kinase